MKKVVMVLLVLLLTFSVCSVAHAKSSDLTVTDMYGNPVNWIDFKLHPQDEYTNDVDTVWVNPLGYGKDELYAAARAEYPDETVIELGGITMMGYDDEYDYIFDYFGPFTAQVSDPNIHNGDKVVVFVYGEAGIVEKANAFRVKEGTFSFRASAAAYCVYVVLD